MRVTPDEHQLVAWAAQATGRTASELMREAVLQHCIGVRDMFKLVEAGVPADTAAATLLTRSHEAIEDGADRDQEPAALVNDPASAG